jgi:hypothetical protein
MKTKLVMSLLVGAVTAVPMMAQAYVGAVKVECWGDCSRVNLGNICDSYTPNSVPIAVACDDTADPGAYTSDVACGGASCRAYGTLVRGDLLSAYCADGGGHDAIVSCSTNPASFSAAPQLRTPAGDLADRPATEAPKP